MGSTPYPGTIQDLTFNLFSILADQPPVSQRPILDNSLDNSQGPWTVDHGSGLLEHLPTQIWMSVWGWGWMTGLGSCASDLGSGIGGGVGGNMWCSDKIS